MERLGEEWDWGAYVKFPKNQQKATEFSFMKLSIYIYIILKV